MKVNGYLDEQKQLQWLRMEAERPSDHKILELLSRSGTADGCDALAWLFRRRAPRLREGEANAGDPEPRSPTTKDPGGGSGAGEVAP